jgi:hypothetical protein
MNKFTSILFVFFISFGFSQVKELQANSIEMLELNQEDEKLYNADKVVLEKIWEKLKTGLKYADLSKDEQMLLDNQVETEESYWDIIGGGCSWYCAGGPKAVSASSFLKALGDNDYSPENAHDLNYEYEWAEGVAGYGIGEYLLYTFEGTSPRITEIKIVNGSVKSEMAYKNNSRVKKLKVYYSDQVIGILNLKDIRGTQTFKFDAIGIADRANLKDAKDWTLKFEIMEVYKGLKFQDTIISEIYFDGIDHH